MFLRSPGSVPQPPADSDEPFVPTAPLDGLMARRSSRTRDSQDRTGERPTETPPRRSRKSSELPTRSSRPSPRHRSGRHATDSAGFQPTADWPPQTENRPGRVADPAQRAPQQRPPRQGPQPSPQPSPQPGPRRPDADRPTRRQATPPPAPVSRTVAAATAAAPVAPASPAAGDAVRGATSEGSAEQPRPLSAPPGAAQSGQAAFGRPSGRVGRLVRSIESVPFDRVRRALLLGGGIVLGAALTLVVILLVSGAG
jgi:hypothetical protein